MENDKPILKMQENFKNSVSRAGERFLQLSSSYQSGKGEFKTNLQPFN